MMTPEKPTMADLSGGKRDRRSDNTDKPVTTPNTRDSKLSCWEDEGSHGTKIGGETMKNGDISDLKNRNTDDELDAKAPPILDVDALIGSGGLENSLKDTDDCEQKPKKLFVDLFYDDDDDDNKLDDKNPKSSATDADLSPATHPSKTPTTLHPDDTDDTKTHNDEKNLTTKATEKTEKNNKQNKNNNNNNNNNKQSTAAPVGSPTDSYKSNVILNITTFKAQTNKWKQLDSSSKALMPFLAINRPFIEKEIIRAVKQLKKKEGTLLNRDDWTKIFTLCNSAQGKNSNKFIKHLGVRLAASDPSELLLPSELHKNQILQGRITNAWAGAYTFYGPGWIPEVSISLDISAGIAKPTAWWNSLLDSEVKTIKPFGTDDIFSDDTESMHDLERHLRLEFRIDTTKTHADPKAWMEAFTKIKDTAGKARDTLLKLAMTPITVFSEEWFTNSAKTHMISSSVTNFWIGAYRLAGGPWISPIDDMDASPTKPRTPSSLKMPSNLRSKTPPKSRTGSEPDKGVSFATAVKSRSLFISRSVRPPFKAKPRIKLDRRKHEDVFYSIECPPLDSDWKEAGVEITAHFVEIVEHILGKDRKAILHPWDSNGPAITKKTDTVKNKTQVRRYVNNLYLRQGAPTVFRMRVSHDVLPSLMELQSTETGLLIEHDHIQEKDRTIIGFLVGSSPLAANLDDMREAHENHSVLFGLKIIAQDQAIKLVPGKNNIPWKLQTKAIHILVGASQAVDGRDRYNRVFGSRNEGGYPQGLQMRFVPDISDARFPATPSTRVKAVKMMSKQKVFQENTKIIPTTTIAGVHTVVAKIGFSLCQILMAIKSTSDVEMGLFISIDENFLGGEYTTTFTVHKDRYDEAIGLIPLFCIIMEAKFGPSAWEWFNEDAKIVLLKYKWDTVEGKVVMIEPDDEGDGMELESDDEYMQAICDIYNVDTTQAGNGFDFDIDFLVEDAKVSKNQYGDSGSVKTFRDACGDNPGNTSDGDSTIDPMDDSIDSHSAAPRSTSPVDLVDTDSTTQATSTLTPDSSTNISTSLEQLMLKNPTLAQQLYVQLQSASVAVSPTQGVDGS